MKIKNIVNDFKLFVVYGMTIMVYIILGLLSTIGVSKSIIASFVFYVVFSFICGLFLNLKKSLIVLLFYEIQLIVCPIIFILTKWPPIQIGNIFCAWSITGHFTIDYIVSITFPMFTVILGSIISKMIRHNYEKD